MKMQRLLLPLVAVVALSGCVSTKDLAKTLRYADQRAISVGEFQFAELGQLRKGKACTVNFMNWLPLFGDGSLITAVESGEINQIRYIGETGYWYFPFSTNCTVVFGDHVKDYKPGSAPAPVAAVPANEATAAANAQDNHTSGTAGTPAAPARAAPSTRNFWQ
jgi:hypothetical protein